MSKPEAGQWWVANDGSGKVLFIVGCRDDGKTVFQSEPQGLLLIDLKGWSGWHHEPRCTGWDWVVPEDPTSPADQPDHVHDLRPQPKYRHKGSIVDVLGDPVGGVTMQNQPDPDEWVVQDRVPVRPDVDRVSWTSDEPGSRITPFLSSLGKMHGFENRHGDRLRVFCRRRDLPPVEPCNREEALTQLVEEGQKLGMYDPQPAKTRVRLFASFGAVHIRMPGEITEGIGREIHYDAETKQFYVEQQ